MNILILGGSGQVGFELVRACQGLGQIVTAARVAKAGDEQLDLTEVGAANRLIKSVQPTVVINAMAYTAVDAAEDDLATAMRVNGDAVSEIAQACGEVGAALIHYSTDYVFDGTANSPIQPTAPCSPLGVYGESKRLGERAAFTGRGDVLVLRTCWVYGSRGKNFLQTMLRLAREHDTLRVVADQIGSPTTARTIATLTAHLLRDWLRSGSGQHIHHLACSGQTSWHGFAQAIFAGAKQRGLIDRVPTVQAIDTSEFPTPAQRPAYSVLDNSSFETAFGLTVPHWSDALDLVLDELAS